MKIIFKLYLFTPYVLCHKVYKGLALQNLCLPNIHTLSKHCWCPCSLPGTVLYIAGYLQVNERASAQEQLAVKPWAWVQTALVIRAGIRCYALPERYRLLEKWRESKTLSQRWLGRGWRVFHVEETLWNGAFEENWNLDNLNWGGRQRNGNSLNKVKKEERRLWASGFLTLDMDPGCAKGELWGWDWRGRKLVAWHHRRPCSQIRTFGHDSGRSGCTVSLWEGEWCTQGHNWRGLLMLSIPSTHPDFANVHLHTIPLSWTWDPIAYLTPPIRHVIGISNSIFSKYNNCYFTKICLNHAFCISVDVHSTFPMCQAQNPAALLDWFFHTPH